MNHLSAAQLHEWMNQKKQFILIDVREPVERAAFDIGGIHIPLSEVITRREELRSEEPVVIYCEKGIRSSLVVQRLQEMGFNNLYNLTGGMTGWKKEYGTEKSSS
ncbi:MAG TPA: rhodanese-like domain-containing protein [Flavipsychrobacter sp.]|jgi:rhodanese-related sulfurtransferase|nr:rhodanese-like domain-containing protein [Flavipsychrobacter sp.]